MGNILINGKAYSDIRSIEGKLNRARQKELYDKQQDAIKKRHTPIVRTSKKIGRNEPCFCGSGKKFKKCCINKEKRK